MKSYLIKTDLTSLRCADRLDHGAYFATASAVATLKGGMPKRLTAVTKSTSADPSANRASTVSSIRTSQVLREILTKNPTVKNFSVQRIVDSIGDRRGEISLMFFSIPGVVPVPGTSKLVGMPTGMIAGQMIAGRTKFKLPNFILARSVPRRSLAVAIHAILPVLERAEKAAKPRWRWASHPAARRILGVFIFLLALTIAFPILGFNVPHAAAILIISFGLVEQDGLAILIGVVAGLASLVLVTGAGVSVRALRSKVGAWVKKISLKLGLKWAATFLKKIGFRWVMMLFFEWAEVLLLWDPEASSCRAKGKKARKTSVE
ncbi:MAG: exopolysaccharide biosynthesis protein [Methylocella sp.]